MPAINVSIEYDGKIMDVLSNIIKLQTESDKPVRQNQLNKLYKELVTETLNSHLANTIQLKQKSLKVSTTVLETTEEE